MPEIVLVLVLVFVVVFVFEIVFEIAFALLVEAGVVCCWALVVQRSW